MDKIVNPDEINHANLKRLTDSELEEIGHNENSSERLKDLVFRELQNRGKTEKKKVRKGDCFTRRKSKEVEP